MIKFECIINNKKVIISKNDIKEAKSFIRKCKYSKNVFITSISCYGYETLEELTTYQERIGA